MSLQDLARQLDEMKAQVQTLLAVAPPAPLADAPAAPAAFNEAIKAKAWKKVLEMISWVNPKDLTLDQFTCIFQSSVSCAPNNVDPDRLQLWRAISCRIPSDWILKSKQAANVIMNMIVHGDQDMTDWAMSQASSPFVQEALTKKMGANDYSQGDLVAWAVYHHNIDALQKLMKLKNAVTQEFVFPRTRQSSWAWANYSQEIKYKDAEPDMGFSVLQFWFNVVAPEMQQQQ